MHGYLSAFLELLCRNYLIMTSERPFFYQLGQLQLILSCLYRVVVGTESLMCSPHVSTLLWVSVLLVLLKTVGWTTSSQSVLSDAHWKAEGLRVGHEQLLFIYFQGKVTLGPENHLSLVLKVTGTQGESESHCISSFLSVHIFSPKLFILRSLMLTCVLTHLYLPHCKMPGAFSLTGCSPTLDQETSAQTRELG